MATKYHVAVNTRLLLAGRLEGIGRFSFEVLKRITTAHPDVQFSFLFDRPFEQQFLFADNVRGYVVPPPSRHPVLWYAGFHITLPLYLRYLRPSLVFSPEFYLPQYRAAPSIITIHDLAYEHYPQDNPAWISRYCRRYSPQYAKQASHILTVSAFTRQDIVQQYGIAAEKISVVYNGASSAFMPTDAGTQQRIRNEYTDGKPYFHFVGAIHPRKNISNLLKGFDLFREKLPADAEVKLLLVGRKGWQYSEVLEVYERMRHKNSVVFTGYVPDNVLNQLYSSSLALCYVPYFEGFGIPPLEAMYAETAVICANTASLPEVVGDAALLVDPQAPTEIAEAMSKLYQDSALRQQLIENGLYQRTLFNWDYTAEKVWKSIESHI